MRICGSCRRLAFGLWLALTASLSLTACGGAASGPNSGGPAGTQSFRASAASYLDQTSAKKAAANGWKQFQATPVGEIDDPATKQGILALFRYSAITADGVVHGFLSVRGGEGDRGPLNLGSILTPPGGQSADATYDLSPTWRDATKQTALDFVHQQHLSDDHTDFLASMGVGGQDNPLAIASFQVQGRTDDGLRSYFVTVVVEQRHPSIAAATSVPIGPQKAAPPSPSG